MFILNYIKIITKYYSYQKSYSSIIPIDFLEITYIIIIILFGKLIILAVIRGLVAHVANLNMTSKLTKKLENT